MKRSLGLAALLACFGVACQATLGSLLIAISLAQDTRTNCVSVSVGHGRPAVAVKRSGRAVLEVGVSEDGDLVGALTVTVQRFATDQCTQPIGAPASKSATLTRGVFGRLDFSFDEEPTDAGVDAGVDAGAPDAGIDAGVDAGCSCGPAPTCAVGTGRCLADGGCGYALADAGVPCGDGGLCSASGACAAECAVRGEGDPCNDHLSCTMGDHCQDGSCQSVCANVGPCHSLAAFTCEADGGCAVTALPDGTLCDTNRQDQCLQGVCLPAFSYIPPNLGGKVTGFPYPTGPWVISAGCEAVIDTGLTPPGPVDGGWCSTTPPVVARQERADAGPWVLLSMTSLDVGADAAVHFVGPLPVALVVMGDATVAGLLSVAPTTTGLPAGANDPVCPPGDGGQSSAGALGAGGAGFGGRGGRGGRDGGLEGSASLSNLLVPLRGGCRGGDAASARGGRSGGALELTVAGTLTVRDGGVITASGQGGEGGDAGEGGGGGGSGGALLLEAPGMIIEGFVSANGGAGGQGAGARGADGALRESARAAGGVGSGDGGAGGAGGNGPTPDGRAGEDQGGLGGGGGGAAGRIVVRSRDGGCLVAPVNSSGEVRTECL